MQHSFSWLGTNCINFPILSLSLGLDSICILGIQSGCPALLVANSMRPSGAATENLVPWSVRLRTTTSFWVGGGWHRMTDIEEVFENNTSFIQPGDNQLFPLG